MSYAGENPFRVIATLWPQYELYPAEEAIVRSVWDNDTTVVTAAHKVGKDFTAALIILVFFLTRHPCRIVATSVDAPQLDGVLWGEVRRFIQDSSLPTDRGTRGVLDAANGGPILVNHMHLRKVYGGQLDGLSYVIGRVAEKGEGMSGHHIADPGDHVPRTLFVADEASGVDQLTMDKSTEWAHRRLLIGNPYECANEFKWGVKGTPDRSDPGGDLKRIDAPGYRRKVLKIRAEDSPNVRWGKAEVAAGHKVTNRILYPGVLTYREYIDRRDRWDKVKQCVGLDGEFYEGGEILLFPPDWLNRAERYADLIAGRKRQATSIGVDVGEGVAETSMCAGDELGVIEERSIYTPDTSVIRGEVLAFARRHNVDPEDIWFDTGGGGKQITDDLRSDGFMVNAVGFGESVSSRVKLGMRMTEEREDERTSRYAYLNRRAQMYGEASELFDPGRRVHGKEAPYALPGRCAELRRQLAPIPKLYDKEGRLRLPPKNKVGNSKEKTLTEILGCSPDRADAFVLMVHGILERSYDSRFVADIS